MIHIRETQGCGLLQTSLYIGMMFMVVLGLVGKPTLSQGEILMHTSARSPVSAEELGLHNRISELESRIHHWESELYGERGIQWRIKQMEKEIEWGENYRSISIAKNLIGITDHLTNMICGAGTLAPGKNVQVVATFCQDGKDLAGDLNALYECLKYGQREGCMTTLVNALTEAEIFNLAEKILNQEDWLGATADSCGIVGTAYDKTMCNIAVDSIKAAQEIDELTEVILRGNSLLDHNIGAVKDSLKNYAKMQAIIEAWKREMKTTQEELYALQQQPQEEEKEVASQETESDTSFPEEESQLSSQLQQKEYKKCINETYREEREFDKLQWQEMTRFVADVQTNKIQNEYIVKREWRRQQDSKKGLNRIQAEEQQIGCGKKFPLAQTVQKLNWDYLEKRLTQLPQRRQLLFQRLREAEQMERRARNDQLGPSCPGGCPSGIAK